MLIRSSLILVDTTSPSLSVNSKFSSQGGPEVTTPEIGIESDHQWKVSLALFQIGHMITSSHDDDIDNSSRHQLCPITFKNQWAACFKTL
ncbi:hypothetical protein RRG08_048041 [Elysia crispata]|uniref:Uncharacterized protein n=1 Tax=Elysia crispata TaxID=231223 RepID=A0AAE0Z2N9_9GAST|nr:hypothetical protein RRG08_048041 [Elysia crispata]